MRAKAPWEDLVNKKSSFADFVSFRQYTYARTQQFLPSLRAAIKRTSFLVISLHYLQSSPFTAFVFLIKQIYTILDLLNKKSFKKTFLTPSYGLVFTARFPEVFGTHFIDCGRIKG